MSTTKHFTKPQLLDEVRKYFDRRLQTITHETGHPMSLMDFMVEGARAIAKDNERLNRLEQAYVDLEVSTELLTCPHCNSRVILDLRSCSACGTSLFGETETANQPQQVAPPQEAKQETQAEVVVEKPAKKTRKKKEDKVEVEVELKEEVKAVEKIKYPTPSDLKKLDVAGLRKLVADFGLKADTVGIKVKSEFAERINAEIALKNIEQESSVTPTKSESPVPTKTKESKSSEKPGKGGRRAKVDPVESKQEVVNDEPEAESDADDFNDFDKGETVEEKSTSKEIEEEVDDLDFELDDVDDAPATNTDNDDSSESDDDDWD